MDFHRLNYTSEGIFGNANKGKDNLHPYRSQVNTMTQSDFPQPSSLEGEITHGIPSHQGHQKQPWRSRLLFLTAVGLLSLGVTAVYSSIFIARQSTSSTPQSQQQPSLPTRIAALGYLEPQGEIIEVSAPAFLEGARVMDLQVKRGDRIQAGQIIAILDNHHRLKASLEQAKTQVAVAQANLAKVQAGAKQGDIQAQNARFMGTKAELEGQIAMQRSTISNLESQLLGERSAQQASIERLKAELANKTTECQRYATLYDSGAVSAQERDRVCLEQEITEQQLREAQANLQRIVNTLQDQIRAAKANLSRTIATLDTQIAENQARLNAVAEVRPVDLQVAQSELLAAEAAVKQAEANLDLSYVKAPRDGQILEVHTWPGEIVQNQGIVALGETAQMYVTAEVYESDITRVQKGQPVTITTDGITEELQGTVEEVGLQVDRQRVLGTNPTADVDARVVEVKVRLNPEDSQRVAHLTHLQVNVIIDTMKPQ
ncbi:ABC transporter membrane fusion protein, probable glycolipid exporter [Crocosphaera subtropica ATCC 51142]|uniref:ABC transporter membrane fusion protein, probable glycolipid exporter n=1 Tax=Crocosphaera subtropica (strain ATCC 51142 / BH68) TaxID=43989 RepID=B1WQ75_CROS5|nr:ABC exporter membrane fusion protein [Crocosphaera subtropica]ACB49997.1 ABC transporter membrane fusion protein, probable glycolipid exporter [Crocosphaera subtropica ATCC 51142]